MVEVVSCLQRLFHIACLIESKPDVVLPHLTLSPGTCNHYTISLLRRDDGATPDHPIIPESYRMSIRYDSGMIGIRCQMSEQGIGNREQIDMLSHTEHATA